VSGLEAALGAARAEVKALGEQLEAASRAQAARAEQVQGLQTQLQLESERVRLGQQQLEQVSCTGAAALGG
jgi:hypothetical protein